MAPRTPKQPTDRPAKKPTRAQRTASSRARIAVDATWASSAEEIRNRAVHQVTAPLGSRLTIRIPGLATLARFDLMPEHLHELAADHIAAWDDAAKYESVLAERMSTLYQTGEDGEAESLKVAIAELVQQHYELTIWLCQQAIVEPEGLDLAAGDLPEIELEWLMRVCTRRTGVDAEGRRIGVVPIDQFATFRVHHGERECPPDCEGCRLTAQALSTVRLREV